jgi:hypothetical protein
MLGLTLWLELIRQRSHSMAQAPNLPTRNHLRSEIRAFLILSAGGFAVGLALGFTFLGLR